MKTFDYDHGACECGARLRWTIETDGSPGSVELVCSCGRSIGTLQIGAVEGDNVFFRLGQDEPRKLH